MLTAKIIPKMDSNSSLFPAFKNVARIQDTRKKNALHAQRAHILHLSRASCRFIFYDNTKKYWPKTHKYFTGMISKWRTALEAKYQICKFPNCAYKCWRRRDMKIHTESVHLGLRPFHCPFTGCSATFELKHGLEDHKKVHDPSSFKIT